MKILKGIMGLIEIVLSIFAIAYCWETHTWLSIAWLVLLSISVLTAVYITGKEDGKKR